jgi:hypothetical protein
MTSALTAEVDWFLLKTLYLLMLCEIVEAMIPSYCFLTAAKEIRDCNSRVRIS